MSIFIGVHVYSTGYHVGKIYVLSIMSGIFLFSGFIFDQTQSYRNPFILVGSMYLVSCLACVPLLRMDKSNLKGSDVTVSIPHSDNPLLE